jgi:hypothetical protein
MKWVLIGVLSACLLVTWAARGCMKEFDGNDPNNISPFSLRPATPEDLERRRQSEKAATKTVPVRVIDVKAEPDGSNWRYFVLLEATNLSKRSIDHFTVTFEMRDATSKYIIGSKGRDVKLDSSLKPGEKGEGLLEQTLDKAEHDRFSNVNVFCTSY